MTSKSLILLCILILAGSGCSVQISASPIPASPAPTFSMIATQPNASATPAAVNPLQIGTAVPTLDPLPVTWASLNLSGKLIYNTVNNTQLTLEIHSLDLATGERQNIFPLAAGAWSEAVAVSPDHKTLLLAYSPPSNAPYGGQESIYAMPVDGSTPPQILIIPADQDKYYQPEWSPDGKTIYFSHVNYGTIPVFEIMRMAYPDGKPERFIDHAYWPRVSLDGKHIVYVALDPDTGKNHLFLANEDGSGAHEVSIRGLPVPQVIDVPMVSPDNHLILFSSPDGVTSYHPNWIDKLLGVHMARADGSLPSDWWSVPIEGGVAKQLTQIQALALYGVYSPDQKFVASYSASGIFVMKPDGTELTRIVSDLGGNVGTVNWIP